MSYEIVAFRGRTIDFTGSLYAADGTTPFVLASTDVVRFKMGRGTATPDVDIRSGAVTANGSTVTVTSLGSTTAAATYTVRLAQADLSSLLAGVYDCEVSVVVDAETAPADAIKLVELGVLHLMPSLAGSLGLS